MNLQPRLKAADICQIFYMILARRPSLWHGSVRHLIFYPVHNNGYGLESIS